MMRALKAGVILLLLLVSPLWAQTDFPDDNDLYVNDYARLLSVPQEAALRDVLEELYDARGIEFTVLTINRTSDYGHSGEIEPFATALFNEWGIGDATRNDGVLLLVSRDDRAMRIEVGSGYGTTMDRPMQRVINKRILPRFRNDEYDKGIINGVNAAIYQLTGRQPGQYDRSTFLHVIDRAVILARIGVRAIGILGLGLLFLASPFIGVYLIFKAVVGMIWLLNYVLRNRPRICPNDGARMRRYLEETEDEALSAGQIVEERLKSVNYDAWFCDQCDHVRIETHKSRGSRFGACRDCGFKTLEGATRTVVSASLSETGLQETNYKCHNCGVEYRVENIIPQKAPLRDNSESSRSRSSSNSSSSSRSRGGGRSSGGGASGRW